MRAARLSGTKILTCMAQTVLNGLLDIRPSGGTLNMVLTYMHRVTRLFQLAAIRPDSHPTNKAPSAPIMAVRARCYRTSAHPPGCFSIWPAVILCRPSRVIRAPRCMLCVGGAGSFQLPNQHICLLRGHRPVTSHQQECACQQKLNPGLKYINWP